MLETSGRLLKLLSLLQARRDWPGGTLADRLGVSPRTVRRDVDRLRELGYPVQATKGPDGGYRLGAGADLPPLLFDADQAVAVAVALQTATTSVDGIEEAALRALGTVRQVMPARLRHRVDALQVTSVRRTEDRPRVDAEVLLTVGAAVRAREVLRFGYKDVVRRCEPHHVVMWGGRWYLVGWDTDRDDWRTFRVDRMTPRTPNGSRFTPRELPAPDVATYIAERFAAPEMPCTGTVVLAAPAAQIMPWVRPTDLVEPLGDDRCRLTLSSWSWVGLAATMGMFDVELEIEGPAELREAAIRLARRYTAHLDR
ncbi:helix-turn-helix transcriptional regulator [Catenuloplanes indicus]|uniref:DNA-binding transcriptional regulator YafY n=1 Tax=Catenuloplanes indicus TaxID=137267 RepID=A0AAE3W7G1_9ACTN|nr:WYL domain-containing protein [Catenuloplanes indicus]MDQ0370692.1 putative DNA-binding transcriptional regulator YafY [Catenuloplanes indicus]